MATFRQEKDRSVVGATEPAGTKNFTDDDGLLGYQESSVQDRLQQDAVMFRAGYDDCYYRLMPRILELEDQLRYYIKHSVAQMFQDIGFDGADSARKRSAQQFRQWYENREADAA